MEKLLEKLHQIAEKIEHRQMGKVKYLYEEILLILLYGIIRNQKTNTERLNTMAENIDLFKVYEFNDRYLFQNGIPSTTTMSRMMNDINYSVGNVEEILMSLLLPQSDTKHIAIDGKYLRGNTTFVIKYKHHDLMVTAYDVANDRPIKTIRVDRKTNEIVATRELLETLDLQDKVITFDAINTQKSTISIIYENGGDYICPIKSNHKPELDAIATTFSMTKTKDHYLRVCRTNNGLGLKEFYYISDLSLVDDYFTCLDDWKGLSGIVLEKTISNKGEVTFRYFITSLAHISLEEIATYIQNHWRIETMHKYLDVNFGEDDCRSRSTNACCLLHFIRKFTLCKLLLYKGKYLSTKSYFSHLLGKLTRNGDYAFHLLLVDLST